MTEVLCGIENCRYINGEKCAACMIELDDDGLCMTAEKYLDSEEYQTVYYKAVKTFGGKIGRALSVGKKITINGEDFYTKNSPYSDDAHTYITHGRTGYYCGTVKDIKEHFKEFINRQSVYKNVEQFPLAEFDNMNREYFYIKKDAES